MRIRCHRRTGTGIASTVFLLCLFLLLPTYGWSRVFLRWSTARVPAPEELGSKDIVVSWNENATPLLENLAKQGYQIYVEASVKQATVAAEQAAKHGAIGILLTIAPSEREAGQETLTRLRSFYPKLRIFALTPDGKQPEMRGSLVIKREAVLEVSSPTAQPWIDSNLSLLRIEQRAFPEQVPLYTFSWNASQNGEQRDRPQATDYLLAVAEAEAFHADLLLRVDEGLQKALSEHDASAWRLWNKVRSYADFNSESDEALEPAANVAIVVDDLDPGDEVVNLLARHNIPFRIFFPGDLEKIDPQIFDVIAVFAKPDERSSAQLTNLANAGKTVVLVDAHGSYPWQKGESVRLNEHTTSYAVGSGKVLELSEPVSDPETFSQDIRRLTGKHVLISLWNGLTTIAVPYGDKGGKLKLVELINYAEEPVRVQVQVRGSFTSVRYETPPGKCCQLLSPVNHDGFTEFVIPDLAIAGRVHLE
jgi:hypothetical protein